MKTFCLDPAHPMCIIFAPAYPAIFTNPHEIHKAKCAADVVCFSLVCTKPLTTLF